MESSIEIAGTKLPNSTYDCSIAGHHMVTGPVSLFFSKSPMLISRYGQLEQSCRAGAFSVLGFKCYLVNRLHSLPVTATKITCLLIFFLVLVSSGAAQTADQPPRTIRVVVDNAYAPYSFQSDDGKLQGILIDQWQAWEKKTGIKAEIHAMDWGEALRRMRAGEFDVIDSIVETAERQAYFDFTPAYATVEASIFFRNDISGISDLASLKGLPVGVQAGDQHIDQLKANGVTTVIVFQSSDAVIEAAKQHKINVFVVDDPSALYLLNKMGVEDEFRHSAPVFRDDLRRAVRKGDAATLRTVWEGFRSIDAAELKQIDEKWFGRTINNYGRYITYAGYAAAVAILLIAGLVGWNSALRKRILQRTAALSEIEEARRKAEQKYKDIFDNALEGIFQTSPDGRFVVANPALARMFGFDSPEELVRERSDISKQHYVDPKRREEFKRLLEEEGIVHHFEYQAYRKDGSRIWVSDNVSAVRGQDGKVLYYEGIANDVTERKRAQESLKLFRNLIDRSSDAIEVLDPSTLRLLDCNAAAYQTLGYTREEFLSLSVFDIDPILDHSVAARVAEEMDKAGFVIFESLHRRKDGSTFPVEINAKMIRLERDYRLAVVRDITERKRTDEKLKATTEQLRALSASVQSAREKEGARIARELHDDLGAALSSLRWDLEDVDEGIAESGNGSQLQDLRKKIATMMKLTDTTINTVRRIGSELRPIALDALGLVEAIELHARQFQDRTGINVECDCRMENVNLDREQSTAVFRIFQEALTNILRHAQATRVDIHISEEGEFILTVGDNGRGITEDEKSAKLSLGLLGMRERTHLIGGTIDIAGSDGKGTLVTVRIPIPISC